MKIKLKKPPWVCAVLVGDIDKKKVLEAKKLGAHLIELRLDTFKKINPIELKDRVSSLAMPKILTIRSPIEGGTIDMGDKKRLDLFREFIPLADFIDVELSSKKILSKVINLARRHGKKSIISYHNFHSTPKREKLTEIIKDARKKGADIVKVATLVKDVNDIKRLAALLINEKNLAVIAMGKFGRVSRIFFPFLGSLISYGSITKKTAPGQFNLKEIKSLMSEFT